MRFFKAILGLLAVLLFGGIAKGDSPPAPPDLSAADVASFFDEFLPQQMELRHAPGAVCIVVKDGRVLFTKGYGFADVGAHLPVIPDRTTFSVGSISKLFTTLAALQLVERGKLSLDQEIATALPGITIDNPFRTPLRLRHLLTHTSGFDQRYVAIAVRRRSELLQPTEYLKRFTPACEMEPGTQISYSEEDHLVAGALIEHAAGMPFTDYVQRNLLDPMSMGDTAFIPRDETFSNHARGYEFNDGALEPMPILMVRQVPSGGMNSTATDLAKFMKMLLSGGSLDGKQILLPQTVRSIAEKQFAYPGQDNGIAMGFYRHIVNDQVVLTHGGVALGTTCNLFILPARGIGVFVCYNLFDTRLLDPPPEHFVERFFPKPRVEPTLFEPGETGALPATRFAGEYRHVSYSRHTMEKVQGLLDRIYVRCYNGKTLVANVLPAGGESSFSRTGPTTFEQIDGTARLTFNIDAQGHVTQLAAGTEGYFRASWYENPILHLHLIELAVLTFLWVALGWPLLRFMRRRGFLTHAMGRRGEIGFGDRILWLTAAIYLLFMGGFYCVFIRTPDHVFIFGLPVAMKALLVLPMVAGALTVICFIIAVARLRDRTLPLLPRLHFASASVVALTLVPILYYWNLLGLKW